MSWQLVMKIILLTRAMQAKIANWLVLSFFPAFTTGELVRAKPSKIVAGQESEKTNEFLQMLSIAILKQVWCVWVWWWVGG